MAEKSLLTNMGSQVLLFLWAEISVVVFSIIPLPQHVLRIRCQQSLAITMKISCSRHVQRNGARGTLPSSPNIHRPQSTARNLDCHTGAPLS